MFNQQLNFLNHQRTTAMNRLLITALSLIAAIAFATPTFQVTSADAATASKSATHKTHHKTHHKTCKSTKTHKCPVAKKKPAKPAY